MFKVKKFPKKLKIFSLKIHKSAGILKNPKTFLNKGVKHNKNYMDGLNSKKKYIKGGREGGGGERRRLIR